MGADIQFGEGPPANPLDPSNVMAIIGYCSGAAPSNDPTQPNVIPIDSPGQVLAAGGYGPAPELANLVSRRGKKRCLLVPCSASTPGSVSSVTQTGQGPLVTVAAIDANGPRDDGFAVARIIDAGVPGVASVAFSWSYSSVNGVVSQLFQGKITVPDRSAAQVLGTVDLTTLTYAKPAKVTGTVDLTGLTYGPGGTLDGLTLIANFDGAGSATCTFSAPASPAQVVSQLVGVFGAGSASINQQNQLVLSGATLGSGGSLVISASTSLTSLGLTAATTNGTAGDLDGLTLIFQADTGGSYTVTFSGPKPGSAADVVSKIDAVSGAGASLFSSKNLLLVKSDTKGSGSTLAITGGTGRSTLGLALVSVTGAESTYDIPHLGLRFTFSPSANGSFISATEYAVTCAAPKPSDADILARIDDIVASGYPFGAVVVASETDITLSMSRAQALDAKMGTLHTADRMKRADMGLPATEADSIVKSTMSSFRSKWVDLFARGVYAAVSTNVAGGGYALRSTSWYGAVVDTFLPLYKDRGDHGVVYDSGTIGLPDVGGLYGDEGAATVKLVGSVGAAGLSMNVMLKDTDGGYYFAGGYSSADGTSRYVDSSVRNGVLRAGQLAADVLSTFQNSTDLDTNPDETIEDASAEIVNNAIEKAIADEMVPDAFQRVKAQVDQTTKFYSTKALSANITCYNRVPARTVSGTIGPGIITTG